MIPKTASAGIALVLVSTNAFALSPILTVLATHQGVTPAMVVVIRFVLALALALVLWSRLKQAIPQSISGILLLLVMGACYAIESIGYATAVSRIPVGLAVLVVYLFPLLVALIVAVADRKPPTPLRWLSLILALLGIGLAVGPDFAALDALGLACAFMTALSAATTIWLGERLSRRDGPLAISAMSMAMAAALYLPAFILLDRWFWPANAAGWSLSLASGGLFYAGLILFFSATMRISTVRASLFANCEPILATGFAYLLLNETPSWAQIPGMALVVVALCLPEHWPPSRAQGRDKLTGVV